MVGLIPDDPPTRNPEDLCALLQPQSQQGMTHHSLLPEPYPLDQHLLQKPLYLGLRMYFSHFQSRLTAGDSKVTSDRDKTEQHYTSRPYLLVD
jgi:hypothetical protein